MPIIIKRQQKTEEILCMLIKLDERYVYYGK